MNAIGPQRISGNAQSIFGQRDPAQFSTREQVAGACLTAFGLIAGAIAITDSTSTHVIHSLTSDQFIIGAVAIAVTLIGIALLVDDRMRCNRVNVVNDIKVGEKIQRPWSCIKKQLDPKGSDGFLLEYEFNQELLKGDPGQVSELFKKIQLEIYPALEKHPLDLSIKGFSNSLGHPERVTDNDIPWADLGFELRMHTPTHCVMQLPDVKTLLGRWNLLKAKGKVKHQLSLFESKDIASHVAFTKAYCDHDALVSSGSEFVHDMLLHVAPLICRILSCEKREAVYKTVQKDWRDSIKKILCVLKGLDWIAINGKKITKKKVEVSNGVRLLCKHRKLLEATYSFLIDNAMVASAPEDTATFFLPPVDEALYLIFRPIDNAVIERVFRNEIANLPADSPVRKDAKKGIVAVWHKLLN